MTEDMHGIEYFTGDKRPKRNNKNGLSSKRHAGAYADLGDSLLCNTWSSGTEEVSSFLASRFSLALPAI
jgi:hypothetical protein